MPFYFNAKCKKNFTIISNETCFRNVKRSLVRLLFALFYFVFSARESDDLIDRHREGDSLSGSIETDCAVERVQDIVLYLCGNEYHNYLFFGLNGYFKKLFGFLVRRTSGVNDRTAARTELLCRVHDRVHRDPSAAHLRRGQGGG